MRVLKGKNIPTEVVSKKLVGTNLKGEEITLMTINQVEEYTHNSNMNKSFVRVLLINYMEGEVPDSFYFVVDEDMGLKMGFIQTTQANQILLDWELAMMQQKVNLNQFITTITEEYFQKELGFSNFRIRD